MTWHYTKDSLPDSDREILIIIKRTDERLPIRGLYCKGKWIKPFIYYDWIKEAKFKDESIIDNDLVYAWAELPTPLPYPS